MEFIMGEEFRMEFRMGEGSSEWSLERSSEWSLD